MQGGATGLGWIYYYFLTLFVSTIIVSKILEEATEYIDAVADCVDDPYKVESSVTDKYKDGYVEAWMRPY